MKVVSKPSEAEAFFYSGPDVYIEMTKWLGTQGHYAAVGSEDGKVFFPAQFAWLEPKGYIVVQDHVLKIYNDTVEFWSKFSKVIEPEEVSDGQG